MGARPPRGTFGDIKMADIFSGGGSKKNTFGILFFSRHVRRYWNPSLIRSILIFSDILLAICALHVLFFAFVMKWMIRFPIWIYFHVSQFLRKGVIRRGKAKYLRPEN
jgi:hypothetical protein